MGSNDEAVGKPRFEPPPWEKEAFDALAARRADEQIAREALAAAAAAALTAGSTVADPIEAMVEAAVAEQEPAAEAPEVAEAADPVADPPAPAKAVVEPELVDAMLTQLANEERAAAIATGRVSQAVAALLMALGAGMAIGGLSLMRSANGKQIIVIGSLVLSVFGMMFMGMAVWVWIATSRSRGRS